MPVKDDRSAFPKYLFHQGKNYRSYEYFGVHPSDKEGFLTFRVWAPRAVSVSIVGDFNGWQAKKTSLARLEDDPSIWEITTDELKRGDYYKFAIETDKGEMLMKADPYAFMAEKGSTTEGANMASVVYPLDRKYRWTDSKWMHERTQKNPYESPMNIYECHFGSWQQKEDGSFYSYREMADKLIRYVKKMHYTHIEILPLMEYPFEGSWGYQVTGFFALTSRYGKPEDFMYFVNRCHRNGIGVFMDWVPAHFPKDAHGLMNFDGHPLYEDANEFRMEHKGWGTRCFDHGKPEVMSFLISSAFMFLDKYHIDGIRVDAVSAMLYLNYDRKDGEWQPNSKGGTENLEAINFLKALNSNVQISFPGALMMAEESTAFPMITMPPDKGGLGFNFKWNMGWMNDTLSYFKTDPIYRAGVHNRLTFSMSYAFSENFILPISHDEVVHGKCSLLNKMPGDYDMKFDGMRAFLVYMMTHPGKKLLFMGQEFGQFIEWNEKQGLDWVLLLYEKHRKLRDYVKELNKFYLEEPALWENDTSWDGFEWIDADNNNDNVFSYVRKDKKGNILTVILNLSGQPYRNFDIGVPEEGEYHVMIDTDRKRHGGKGSRRKPVYKTKKAERNGFKQYITLNMPALSAIILKKKEG